MNQTAIEFVVVADQAGLDPAKDQSEALVKAYDDAVALPPSVGVWHGRRMPPDDEDKEVNASTPAVFRPVSPPRPSHHHITTVINRYIAYRVRNCLAGHTTPWPREERDSNNKPEEWPAPVLCGRPKYASSLQCTNSFARERGTGQVWRPQENTVVRFAPMYGVSCVWDGRAPQLERASSAYVFAAICFVRDPLHHSPKRPSCKIHSGRPDSVVSQQQSNERPHRRFLFPTRPTNGFLFVRGTSRDDQHYRHAVAVLADRKV
jgi:hypothetical protein